MSSSFEFTPVPILPVVESRLVGNAVLVAFTLLVVALRIVARLVTGSRLGWDDYLILAAVPQGIGILVCQGLWATAGAGYPITEVPPQNLEYIATIFTPFETIYDVCIVTAKLSVLFFYLRVFTGMALMQRLTKAMMVLVVVWGTGNLLQSLLVCRVSQCSSNVSSLISTGLFNCLTNVIINFLPLYTIWSLKTISVSTRFGLTIVFLFSVNVTWVSVLRIAGLAASVSDENPQPMVVMETGTFLAVLEVNLSILCNSLPMLLPLYSFWRYRRVYGEGEDEYVSRVRGDEERGNNGGAGRGGAHARDLKLDLLHNITNGLPLETIYGEDDIHFVATVGTGSPAPGAAAGGPGTARGHRKTRSGGSRTKKSNKKSKSRSRTRTRPGSGFGSGFERFDDDDDDDEDEDESETGSTRNLSRDVGAGIKIETKWTITEETRGPRRPPES